MSGQNKSGYELRSNLLGMATGILENRNRRLFDNEMIKAEGYRNPIAPYTTEDVIAEATKLYDFVKNKD